MYQSQDGGSQVQVPGPLLTLGVSEPIMPWYTHKNGEKINPNHSLDDEAPALGTMRLRPLDFPCWQGSHLPRCFPISLANKIFPTDNKYIYFWFKYIPQKNLDHTYIKKNLFVVYLKFTLNWASCVLPDNCTWEALENTSVWLPHQDAGFQVALTVFQKSQMILIS